MKKQALALALIACTLLSACSKNPLLQKRPDEAARLLLAASSKAMKEMGHKSADESAQYMHCMEPELKPAPFDCDTLYQHMREILAKDGLNLSIRQLKDTEFYASVREDVAFKAMFLR
jgi:hypothetical protein